MYQSKAMKFQVITDAKCGWKLDHENFICESFVLVTM